MWKELVEIFKGVDPLQEVADQFIEMVGVAYRMAEGVRSHVHEHGLPEAEWKAVLKLDQEINEREWAIRRALVSHIALQKTELPYCLKLMSLVKDAERLGEYVKNVAEVTRHPEGAVTEGPLRDGTEAFVATTMKVFSETRTVIAEENTARAEALIEQAKTALAESDALVEAVRTSDVNAAQASSTALIAFFYRRIASHLINLISSVVLPVHELDRHDERFAEA